MQNTFLLRHLRRLTKTDWKELRLFVHSPWANQREEVTRLFDHLDGALHGKGKVAKTEVWQAVFPGEKFSDKKLHYTSSFLLAVVRQYLMLAEARKDDRQQHLHLCRALRKRGLHDDFEKEMKAAQAALEKHPDRNPRHHFDKYLLEVELAAITTEQRRGGEMNWQAILDELTTFFIGETLRQSCNLLTHQKITGKEYNLNLLDAVLKKIETDGYEKIPAVAIYFHAYMALFDSSKNINSEKTDAHFAKLKQLLENMGERLPADELGDIYLLAINFCIKRLNQGEQKYIREAFDLYQSGLSAGALLKEGIISGPTYKNASRIGLALGENKWVSEFLIKYKKNLPAHQRENIWCYNQANYHFRLGEYGEAMNLLRHVEFKDKWNNLDARRMLLCSYYELRESQALDNLLDTFQAYIKRQKEIGYQQEMYLNLVKFTRKLMEVESKGKAARKNLRSEIEKKEKVAGKEWLLDKCRI